MHSNSSTETQTRRPNGEFGPSIHVPGEVDLDVEVGLPVPQRSAEEERLLEYAKVLRQAERDARSRTASPLELAQLVRLFPLDSKVAENVAANIKTSKSDFKTLVFSPSHRVRANVGANALAPTDVRRIAVMDKDYRVRMATAASMDLGPELQLLLAQDRDVSVREALARNLDLASEVVEQLNADESIVVRQPWRTRHWLRKIGSDLPVLAAVVVCDGAALRAAVYLSL